MKIYYVEKLFFLRGQQVTEIHFIYLMSLLKTIHSNMN